MATRDSHAELALDPDREFHHDQGRPLSLLLVGLGGIVGTVARYGVTRAIPGPEDWPVATFVVNMVGAFALGVVLESLARRGPDVGARRRWRLVAGVGFCGAFTTYSTFAFEVTALTRAGHHVLAASYGIATLLVGFVATVAGIGLSSRQRPAAAA